jgi:hypothetical protein
MSAAQRTVDKTTPLVEIPNNTSLVIFFDLSIVSRSVVEKAPTRLSLSVNSLGAISYSMPT